MVEEYGQGSEELAALRALAEEEGREDAVLVLADEGVDWPVGSAPSASSASSASSTTFFPASQAVLPSGRKPNILLIVTVGSLFDDSLLFFSSDSKSSDRFAGRGTSSDCL